MGSFSYLSGYRVNLSLLQENANREFLEILDKADGSKAIIWDLENIFKPAVKLMIDSALFQHYRDIEHKQLKAGPLPALDVKNIIFITRPDIQNMDYIAENLLSENCEERKYRGARKDYYLYFVPRRSEFCEKRLVDRDVFGSFSFIGQLKWEFYPLDKDLISMERPNIYRDLVIDEDQTCLYEAAQSLVNLQKLYGRIPKIYGKGNYAEKIWEYAKVLGREEKGMFNSGKGVIDQLIILDRSTDLMSVLATQLTYEGLIDEIFGINHGIARFPLEKFSKQSIEKLDEKKEILLNSGEDLFTKLRDQNFNEVGLILSKHARDISKEFDERHIDKSVQEMKKFVEKLPEMMAKKQSVTTHTTIGEMIKEVTDSNEFLDDLAVEQDFMSCIGTDKINSYIEDLLAKKADFKKVIRLICMQCTSSSGFKIKMLDYYKRELIQVYGLQALLSISNLEKAGLLKTQLETRTYAVLNKTLKLTVDEVKEVSPSDISYVHSFYAPLTIRIVEQIMKPNGWQSVKNVLNIVPTAAFEDFQAPLVGIGGRRNSYNSDKSSSETSKVVCVFFFGGCTFAEISALRFLSKQPDSRVEFVVATTKVLNKNTFLETLINK